MTIKYAEIEELAKWFHNESQRWFKRQDKKSERPTEWDDLTPSTRTLFLYMAKETIKRFAKQEANR